MSRKTQDQIRAALRTNPKDRPQNIYQKLKVSEILDRIPTNYIYNNHGDNIPINRDEDVIEKIKYGVLKFFVKSLNLGVQL